MVDIHEWERQLGYELAEIRRNGQQVAKAIAQVRGCGQVRGVTVEVDADGDITNLQIAPGAMRWTSNQLTVALLDCHRRARTDAKAKVERLARKADPRIRGQLDQLRGGQETPASLRRPMSDEEAEEADDAYFERMNRKGWKE